MCQERQMEEQMDKINWCKEEISYRPTGEQALLRWYLVLGLTRMMFVSSKTLLWNINNKAMLKICQQFPDGVMGRNQLMAFN